MSRTACILSSYKCKHVYISYIKAYSKSFSDDFLMLYLIISPDSTYNTAGINGCPEQSCNKTQRLLGTWQSQTSWLLACWISAWVMKSFLYRLSLIFGRRGTLLGVKQNKEPGHIRMEQTRLESVSSCVFEGQWYVLYVFICFYDQMYEHFMCIHIIFRFPN